MAAELWINDGGTARKPIEVWVNDGGVARRITAIWVNDGGVARQIFAGILLSTDFSSRNYNGLSGANRTTNVVTATGTPGGGTYSWTRISGDVGTESAFAVNASSAATSFRLPSLGSGATLTATFRCTYTLGGASKTVDVTATWSATD